MTLNLNPLIERAEHAAQDTKHTRIAVHTGTRLDDHGNATVGGSVVLKIDRAYYDRVLTSAGKQKKRSKHIDDGTTADQTTNTQ